MGLDMGMGRQQALDKNKRSDTLSSATFEIEADGKTARFSELTGISSEVTMADYMEAGEHGPEFGRFIGQAKPPTVQLKRAMGTGGDTTWIWAWHALARTGAVTAYKQTYLKLFGAGSPDKPLKTYELVNAVATKVDIAGMKAGATDVVVQSLTMQCDEINEAP